LSLGKNQTLHIGLLAAMPEELGTILDKLGNLKEEVFGDLKIYSGFYKNCFDNEIFITTAWSGWGKTSAARATTRLCSSSNQEKKIDLILFTGVAGSADINLKQWDILLADSVVNYDLDASPIFERFEIPALKQKKLIPSKKLSRILRQTLLKAKEEGKLKDFGNINEGLIGTGDRFISNLNELEKIKLNLPDIKGVEMEGAAFAQVATQENIDWLIMRVISDDASNNADLEFNQFLKIYKDKSWNLIKYFLDALSHEKY
tara:strand:+ start:269 stop:1048 length:780 start_codon:yes stop_codon:yes gene_type:complete